MFWPDYTVRRRRKSRWGCVLLLGLAAGLIGAVLVNGWWRTLSPLAGGAEPAAGPLAATPSPRPSSAAAGTPEDAPKAAATSVAPDTGATTPAARPGEAVTIGEPAPPFSLPDLFDEEKMHVLDEYRGRPVILNFWASWCAPCRREMPALQETAARYEEAGVLLLGMNQTYLDDLAAAHAFVEELGLTFPQTRDDNGSVGAGAYRVVGIPTTVFITPDGHVAHIQVGEMSLEQITTLTERLVDGRLLQP